MLLVIPVVAMLIGRGLRVGVDLILTPDIVLFPAAAPLMALPGLPALAVLFSRDMPRIEGWLVGLKASISHFICSLP